MDMSSLTETQQQQLQQLHQQFQQHQQEQQLQQQQQQQHQAYEPSQLHQAYDPSQTQSYDQSYYSYPHYQQPQQQQQHQQQYHSYYQPDYTNTYQTQNDSTPIQPPGISAAPEATPQQSSYYPATAGAEQQQPNSSSSYPVPSGLNPAAAAAVAALSQLTQFAGTMDAAERAMAGLQQERQWQGKSGGGGYGPGGPMPMQMPSHMAPHGGYHHMGPYPGQRGGRPPYRGGGRRGGGPFRSGGGGGRGNSGQRPSRADGPAPQVHGRGRGRGGNRRFPQRASSHQGAVPTGEPMSEHGDVEASTAVQGETPASAPVPPLATGKTSTRRQPQIAWCELCRVDCTSLEILEQHKNGKKHKKNLQRFEELQKAGNSIPTTVTNPALPPVLGTDNAPLSASAPAPIVASAPNPGSVPSLTSSSFSEVTTTVVPEVQNQHQFISETKSEAVSQAKNVEGSEPYKTEAPENMSTEVPNNDNKLESEQQIDNMEHAVDGEPTEAPGKKRRADRFDARKRGMNKKMRGGRGGKRMKTYDRATRAVEHVKPKEVVPIICDLCNVKCDTQAVFETHLAGKKHISKLKRFQGHQAMYGPLGLQALYPPNPNTQSIFIPQAHQQQTMYAPEGSFHQQGAYVPQAAAVSELQDNQKPESHGAPVTWNGSQNDVAPVSEERQGAVAGQEGQLFVGNMPESSAAGSEEKAVDISSETPVFPQPVNTVMGSENVAPAKDDVITVADFGVTTAAQNVIFPGLDTKMEDET